MRHMDVEKERQLKAMEEQETEEDSSPSEEMLMFGDEETIIEEKPLDIEVAPSTSKETSSQPKRKKKNKVASVARKELKVLDENL
ncbi:hypothetical protein L2E82_50601 [Cichorium intybus]|nr:hypothetical protein L2E82_50601 [Cichorium intybus]